MTNPDNETKDIIDSFVSEGYERLEDAEQKMPMLESENHQEIVNTIFRLFHSIKGSAGYLNFENIKQVTHEAETLLDIFRKEGKKPCQDEVDLLYQTLDFLRQLIGNVENFFDDKGFEEKSAIMVNTISESIKNLRNIPGNPPEIPLNPAPAAAPAAPAAPELDSLVTPDLTEKFITESLELLDSSEKSALELDKNPNGKEKIREIFRNIHTLKGNAGFFSYSVVEKKSMELENLLEDMRNNKIGVDKSCITGLLRQIDSIRREFVNPDFEGNNKSREYKPIGEILVEMGATNEEAVQKALEDQSKPIGEILVSSGQVTQQAVKKALDIQQKSLSGRTEHTGEMQRKEIRVDTSKLDKLFDLVGELITAQGLVVNNPDLKGLKLENFSKSANALNKITREIQEVTMMIRMIPLEGLFTKMTRLVRDLSKKSNKTIDFEISGAETEMDKNVIEQISDPLVHLLRNAIDHGIESPQIRCLNKKRETGKINLDAKYEGSEIWITVRDDGAGLNRSRIMDKAVEKGLLKNPMQEASDKDVWRIIFEPGFSTAENISEVSGRGVGMDVVKKNIDKLHGKIDIISAEGKGSEFILKIPLTMAIIDGITIKTGENLYSIPLIDIVEFFKAKNEQITRTEEGGEVVNLRGQIMPLIKLYEVFNIKSRYTQPTEGINIVVKSGGRKACIFIDEIIGNQQIVIKSLSEYLGKVDGISGCSILGDGNVSFIIDTGSFINRWVS